jgi:hypothetical protein
MWEYTKEQTIQRDRLQTGKHANTGNGRMLPLILYGNQARLEEVLHISVFAKFFVLNRQKRISEVLTLKNVNCLLEKLTTSSRNVIMEIPKWDDCEAKFESDGGELNPLEKFVYWHEDPISIVWRGRLLAAIKHVVALPKSCGECHAVKGCQELKDGLYCKARYFDYLNQ